MNFSNISLNLKKLKKLNKPKWRALTVGYWVSMQNARLDMINIVGKWVKHKLFIAGNRVIIYNKKDAFYENKNIRH